MREDHCLETVPQNGQDDDYADDGKEDGTIQYLLMVDGACLLPLVFHFFL
jgi:hypothetical protein